MSGLLIDTSVLSALAPGRPRLPTSISDWMLQNAGRLHLSVMTLIEVEEGIAKLRRQGASGRADELGAWLAVTSSRFGRKLLGIDIRLAGVIGHLADRAIAIGRHPGLADIVIAATAQANDMMVLTCNTRHFEPLGVAFADPFERLP